jgi:hypothetical protein
MSLANPLAFHYKATSTIVKRIIVMAHGVNFIKLLWGKITHTFYKLGHFINISNICCIVMKRSSLQNRVSIFML